MVYLDIGVDHQWFQVNAMVNAAMVSIGAGLRAMRVGIDPFR